MNKQLQNKHQTTRKLDRRNAIKNIDYDATSSPSSSFSDIIPSFRVEGVEGDFDIICRSLGLSGPEDFAIPAAAWEARKSPQGFGNGRNSKSCELGSSRNSEDFCVVDTKIGSLGFDNRNSKSCELGSSRNSEEFSDTSFNLKDMVEAKINEKGFDSQNSTSCDLASNRNSQNFRATSSNRDDLLGSIEAKIIDKPNSKSYELANNRKPKNFRATSSNRDDYLYTVDTKVRVSGNERNKKGIDNRNLGFCEWPYNQNTDKIRVTSSNRNDFLDTVEDKIRVSENEKRFEKNNLGELANNQIREKSGVTGSNGDGLSDTVEATIRVSENEGNEKGFDNRNFGSREQANNQKSGITGLCRDDLFDTIEATFRVGGNEENENEFSQAETGVKVRHCNEVKCGLCSHLILEKNGVIDSNWENNSLKISEPNVRVRESKRIEYDFAPGVIEVRVRRTDECFSVRSFRSGGIKGARPPLLAPPPVISPSQNTDYTSSSWDLLKSFGPPSDEVSVFFTGSSLIEKETTIENKDGNDRRRQDVDGEWLGDIRVVTESSSDTSEDKDDDTNVKMEPLHFVSPLGKFKCTINSWQKGDFLGSGSFGTVYEGFTDDGIFFAVKEVSLLDQGDQGKQSIYQLEQEIFFLSQFEHENIVQYLGTDKDNGKLYIFLELVTKGSLASLYQKYNLQDSQVSAYTRQILNGLNYLHLRKVVHRDIKCANILVDASGSVKLADFGLAKATNLNDVKSCKGTAFWMAPEVVNRKNHGYGLAADIWSLGCTVLEMLTRRIPYSHLEGMQALFRIGKGEPPPVPNSLSREARDFISKCLRVNPDDRPTAAQLLNHPFVKRPLTTFSAPTSPFYHATRS